jgi:acyl-coenzyme A thioesterase PaaI-like protein
MYMPFRLSSSPPLPPFGSYQMSQVATPRAAAATGSEVEFPRTLPLVRVIAMPADANPNGDIFGGWLLSQMDLAGGSLAAQRARGRCATVAVDGMVFHEPVFVGDEVSFYGEPVKTGRTAAPAVRRSTQGHPGRVHLCRDRRRPPAAPAPAGNLRGASMIRWLRPARSATDPCF